MITNIVGRHNYIWFYIAFIVFFCLVIIIIVKKTMQSGYSIEKKKKLVEDSKFISEKREKYEKMMNEYNNDLQPKREQVRKSFIIYGIVCVIPFIMFFITQNLLFLLLFIIVVIGFGLVFTRLSSGYYRSYAQKTNQTIATILKEFDNNLDYYPSNGYNRTEYMSLYFGEYCDHYSSNDMIINTKTGFCYANVLTEREEEDKDGDTYYVTEFDGTLARLGIKNVGCTIILGGLSNKSFRKSDTFEMIKFENDDFNKEFLCFSDNELISYKILTPDIMEEFINIKKNTIGDIDIRIVNDKLYIRFRGTNGFDEMGENLFESMAVLEEIIKTMDKIKIIIDNRVVD